MSNNEEVLFPGHNLKFPCVGFSMEDDPDKPFDIENSTGVRFFKSYTEINKERDATNLNWMFVSLEDISDLAADLYFAGNLTSAPVIDEGS